MKGFVILLLVAAASAHDFHVCPQAPTDLNATKVVLSPEPPVKGSTINIDLFAFVDEQMRTGSQFMINVFFNGVQIFTDTENIKSSQAKLPVGPCAPPAASCFEFKYGVLIPDIAPPGPYEVQLSFIDQDGNTLTCVAIDFQL